MPRATRLYIEGIDEVSSVDRGSSAPALIAIAKRDTGEEPAVDEFYDEQGNLIPEDELESGMTVYSEAGDPVAVWYSEEDIAEGNVPEDVLEQLAQLEDLEDASELDEDRELTTVGKSAAVTGGQRTLDRTGRRMGNRSLGQGQRGFSGRGRGGGRGRPAGGGDGGAGSVSKSAGEKFLDSISKAYKDADRDQIIAQTFDSFAKRQGVLELQVRNSERIAKRLEDEANLRQYVELAEEYGLPVDSQEFAGILAAIGDSGLSKRQLDTLDRVFSAAADADALTEIGASGAGSPSAVMDQVYSVANDGISKSANAGVSIEAATTAIFADNPDAYEQYLLEQEQARR